MDIRKVLSFDNLYSTLPKAAIDKLSLILERTDKGSDQIYMTPIGSRVGPDIILKGWDTIFNSQLEKMNGALLEIEENQRSKYGPRSIAVPWSERVNGVINSFVQDDPRPIALGEVTSLVPVRSRLRPLSLQQAATFIKSSTNSGLPFMVRKGNILDLVVSDFNKLYDANYPAVLFTRTQESKKTRTVWGVDIATVLNEMRFYRPVLEIQKKQPWRAALRSADELDTAITNLIQYARGKGKALVSIDFSTYDDTVKRELQKKAFEYISQMFQSKFSPQIKDIQRRFNTVALITPDGVFSGEHGIPSGSAFTNEIGSITQYLISSLNQFDTNFAQIQGDDGVYASDSPDALFDNFEKYGLKVNKDKSDVSQDYVVFLQNLYHIDYIRNGKIPGIYPTYRALLRIVYQERFDDFSEYGIKGKDYYAIRTLSILENVKNHPLFVPLVKYVISLDKYGLIPSDQGISAFVKMKEIQDGKDVSFTSHLYSSSSGIKDFDSYKLVKRLTV